METSQGVQEFKDYPLKFNWGKRLRNLKFTRTMKTLMDMQIISPCVATTESVRTWGKATPLQNGKDHKHTVSGQEIFTLHKWGSTVNVYSFLRVWVATDNNYVQVMPAPSVRGQHCGLCGNFNRNMFDEWTGKTEQPVTSAADMVNEWRWSQGP